ncbi:MAG: T9SS type A sorting domain-containing protein [Bacteroidota bacterium]
MKKNLLILLISAISIASYSQTPLPYTQDFEAITFPPAGWQRFPIGSLINWERDTTVSGYGIGTACTSFDNFNNGGGTYYGIRLPFMNFTSVTQPYIRFDIAYALRPGNASDVFGLWWSNNGSSNWQNLINYSSSSLTTAPPSSILFVPTASQWNTKLLSLSALAGLPYVRLAIEDDCNHGNKLYFDNVLVFDSSATGITEIYNSNQPMIFPNPFNEVINIISDSQQRICKAELYNSLGLIVSTVEKNNSILKLENLSGLTQGIYFLRFFSDKGKVINKKIIKN